MNAILKILRIPIYIEAPGKTRQQYELDALREKEQKFREELKTYFEND